MQLCKFRTADSGLSFYGASSAGDSHRQSANDKPFFASLRMKIVGIKMITPKKSPFSAQGERSPAHNPNPAHDSILLVTFFHASLIRIMPAVQRLSSGFTQYL